MWKIPNRQEFYPYRDNRHVLQNGDNDSDKTENYEIAYMHAEKAQ
jgi:hypothetical protein